MLNYQRIVDVKVVLSTRNYIMNCSNATPSIWSDLTMACVLSNEEV